uniref:(northern house mosquito) hypothetical protein n=1 Tax=Culex pipiens TaxID=7175 RepID=A0A8D8I8C9_CULPI
MFFFSSILSIFCFFLFFAKWSLIFVCLGLLDVATNFSHCSGRQRKQLLANQPIYCTADQSCKLDLSLVQCVCSVCVFLSYNLFVSCFPSNPIRICVLRLCCSCNFRLCLTACSVLHVCTDLACFCYVFHVYLFQTYLFENLRPVLSCSRKFSTLSRRIPPADCRPRVVLVSVCNFRTQCYLFQCFVCLNLHVCVRLPSVNPANHKPSTTIPQIFLIILLIIQITPRSFFPAKLVLVTFDCEHCFDLLPLCSCVSSFFLPSSSRLTRVRCRRATFVPTQQHGVDSVAAVSGLNTHS